MDVSRAVGLAIGVIILLVVIFVLLKVAGLY